jgi:5-formyltetrahydrofolate cyclo-ligase
MNQEKAQLRTRLKQKRLQMTEAERTLKSREIVERLKEVNDWSAVKNLHYYEPIAGLMEVYINGFVTWLEDTYPHTNLFTPRLIGKQWDLISVRGAPTPDKFDAVIVPMLGFDEKLNRIGYGGGYYDRFLATQPQAAKIGVCFESARIEKIPIEPHDIPLDVIVTEKAG